MTTASVEIAMIERLARALPRSPRQLNALHASDAELVHITGTTVLAVTTDGIVEEIATGLYADPALIGWMTVVVNASDLAAVGANPLGIVVCETLPPTMGPDDIAALQRGIADASLAHGLPVLGGDTNSGEQLQVVGTALGLVEGGAPLTRLGAASGDRLFASGPLGLGSVFAFTQLIRAGVINAPPFRPHARLHEGSLLRPFASACMDTSDGLLATLDELGRLNGVGFRLTLPVEGMLHGAALRLAEAQQLPPWTMLAGPHGEFELVFTVPAVGASWPMMILSNVVLPRPFRPATPMRWPFSKVKLNPRNSVRPPRSMPRLLNSTTRLPSAGGGGMHSSTSSSITGPSWAAVS